MSKIAPEETNIHELLRKRWSARSFSDQMISDEELVKLFTAASWASSSMNEQPWRFVYGKKGTSTFEQILSTLMPGNAIWAANAAVLIAVFAKNVFDDGNANIHAWHDVGAACTKLLLQGADIGIFGHQMGGFDRSLAKSVFQYPETHDIISILALGFLGDPEQLDEPFRSREISPRTRKSPEEIAFTSFSRL
jgi:nitroreductase